MITRISANATGIRSEDMETASWRNHGMLISARMKALLRKKYSPALTRSRLREDKGRKASRIGVDVGEYCAICLVSAASSIGEFEPQAS